MADGMIKWIFVFLIATIIDASIATSNRDLSEIYRYGRVKRQITCAKRYQTVTPGHTRCLPASSRAEDLGDVTPDQQRKIVDLHNKARSDVRPTALNMVKMSWDDSLAVTAKRWAFNCIQNHDKGYKRYEFGRFSVGQNLAWASYDMGWEGAIGLWADEVKDFIYGGPNSLAAVGHYTQMVWATSVKVGCGLAKCSGTFYYVCNYGPAGNNNFDKPYESGPPCSNCPGRCRDNICDCGDLVCLNGAELDLSTCTCKCDKRFHIPPYCGLNCTDIENTQPRYCSQFGVSGCSIYSNVPQECPLMCGWCPDADYSIIKQGTDTEPSSADRIFTLSLSLYVLPLLYILFI